MTKTTSKKVETEFQYVAIKNLSVIWVQAQRPFNEKWAKQIAEEFDPDKFDPPVITKPNGVGHYHVVEGQHRVQGAKIAFGENEQLHCRIVDADDPARAAEIWLGINSGRKAIKPIQKFLVAVTAGRQPEVEINNTVNKMGYKISQYKSEGSISAVRALTEVHNKFGHTLLQGTLLMLHHTWPHDANAFSGDVIRGYALFINEFRHYLDSKRLAEVISKTFSPNQLLSSARLSSEQHRISLAEAMSDILRLRYNRNMRDEKSKLKRK